MSGVNPLTVEVNAAGCATSGHASTAACEQVQCLPGTCQAAVLAKHPVIIIIPSG
jgi:hypothetical protein